MPEALIVGTVPMLAADLEQRPERSPTERLLTVLEAHAGAEAESLADYQRLVRSTTDPVVRLLMQMLLDDELHHHRLLERMATTVRDALHWTRSADALPSQPTSERAAADEALVSTTKARIREEHEGVRHLRELARREGHLGDGLFGLLLEVMAMDGEKHERVLRFLQHRLERRG